MNTLVITEEEIRSAGPGNALQVCWRQWRMERRLASRGIHFRDTDPETVAKAYRDMSEAEFDAINGRQDWANWRTIPRALSGHIPDKSLRIIDLGCGTGSSTRVLAWYAPSGTHIIGYEFAEPLLDIARRRVYRNRKKEVVSVDFLCQEVTAAWRQQGGAKISDNSVDVVNASGVVGHHFNATTIGPLIAELDRVLTPGGVAMLDVGPSLGPLELRRILDASHFTCLGHYRSGWWDPTGEMVFAKSKT